ncbi:unnamed protein product [Mesocestoides corti]|uniref:Telomeric repeat-binding factor 2-interacting protein 1 n=1 Tax=Mesocestoides corti TaxID=53468 RepID=A0A0R3U4G6_MESCO|nr:unnamed protein product [Mesocestoides corti]
MPSRQRSQQSRLNVSELAAVGLHRRILNGSTSKSLVPTPDIPYIPSLRFSPRILARKESVTNLIDDKIDEKSLPRLSFSPRRNSYTDLEDWNILNYLIANDLLDEVNRRRTWTKLEEAGLVNHSSESMRSHFIHNIIHRLPQVLRITPEGKTKSATPGFVKKLQQRLFASLKIHLSVISETDVSSADVSCITSDNSVHDGDPRNFTPPNVPRPPLSKIAKLVEYDDNQPQPNQSIPEELSNDPSPSPSILANAPSNNSFPSLHSQRISAGTDESRIVGNCTRSRHSSPKVPDISDTPSSCHNKIASSDPECASMRFCLTRHQECDLVESDGPIPRSGPSAYQKSVLHRVHVSPKSDLAVENAPQFSFMDPQREADISTVISRTVDFGRQLDFFARRFYLALGEAALLLHVTSGDFVVAERLASTGDTAGLPLLWFPSDDDLLLSVSPSDVQAVFQKFGAEEVSRRLQYHSDQSLFSSCP